MNNRVSGIIGGGYDDFWKFRGRYRAVKGGRASKKSRTAALWYIINMMSHPGANLLVVRKTFNTLRNSCFAELKWAIERLGVGKFWEISVSPLEMTCHTGGKIFFKGLSDAYRLTSLTSDKGKLCWIWAEEAYEIEDEGDFDIIDESVRGAIPPGLFKQTTLTFNPWSGDHWLKKRFFDVTGGDSSDILAMTADYTCNEWLDGADRAFFEKMRVNNPKRFKVAGLGEWGLPDGLVYDNWEERVFDIKELTRDANIKSAFGLDFGYTNDPTALCCMLVDAVRGIIYVFDEMYEYGLSNRAVYDRINVKGYRKEKIFADAAEPKSIDELYALGLTGIRKARKGADSVNYGIQFIQGHKIAVLPKCVNFIKEISAYAWEKSAAGRITNTPRGGYDHLMDAMRYGLSGIAGGEKWGF